MEFQDHTKIQTVKELRYIAENLEKMNVNFSQFLDFIQSDSVRSLVLLPKDCEGVLWTGEESGFVLKDDDNEDCRFLDGLLYAGKDKWFIFSQSANGNNFTLIPCSEAKHYYKDKV